MTMRQSNTHFEVVPIEVAKKILEEEKKKKEEAALKKKSVSNIIDKDYLNTLQYPDWQRPLQEALVELDNDKLKARVAAVEAAIFNRLQVISQSANHHSEREAIENALACLRVLKRESLGFPDWEKE